VTTIACVVLTLDMSQSLDQYVANGLTEPGQGKALLTAALTQVIFPQRQAKRKPNARIDEVWSCLKAPPGCKLWFKLMCEVRWDSGTRFMCTVQFSKYLMCCNIMNNEISPF
jgi:hypothetical protein